MTMRSTLPVALALVLAGAAALVAQPPLTPTPTAAPGYTNVVVTNNPAVLAMQQGPWSVKPDGVWNVRLADTPVRTIAEAAAVPIIRAQQSYNFSWAGGSLPDGSYSVLEVGSNGWVRAATTENGRRRELWINTQQLAAIEVTGAR